MFAALAASSCVQPAEAAPPRETITPAFREVIPNIPGKSLIGVVVSYPPGGAAPAHHHPRCAFVTGFVLSGAIRSQVNDGKVQVFHAGESWTEPPGAHHQISENASATEPASLLAIFVVDTNDTAELTTLERNDRASLAGAASVAPGAKEVSIMAGCLFLAGASGVIGRRLAPLLVASGWRVQAT